MFFETNHFLGSASFIVAVQQKTPVKKTVSLRINQENLNHHLWNNHGTWWLHYTLHLPDYTKRRVRKSLSTHNVEEARQRRDEILATTTH